MSYVLVTVAAVALLGLLHLAFAVAGAGAPGERRPFGDLARDLAGGRDPWTRLLVAAALAATLFALGVVAVPALFGNGDESVSTLTRPTVTTPTAPTGTTATSIPTTTTAPTTTPTTTTTTTTPTTTTPPPPPPGKIVLVRAVVDGQTGRVVRSVNRVGSVPIVRRVGVGVYRVLVPGLTRAMRRRAIVRVSAGIGVTAQVQMPEASPALMVFTQEEATGSPASRNFTLVVYGARSDIPRKPLPKTT